MKGRVFPWLYSSHGNYLSDRSGLKTVVKNTCCQVLGSAVLYVDYYSVQIMVNPAHCP